MAMNDLLFAAVFVFSFTYRVVDIIRRLNHYNRRFYEE